MADRSFDTFRDQMAASFPSLDSLLEGGEGGLENWWEAAKDLITEQLPAAKNILDQLDFVGLYQSNAATLSRDEIPFIRSDEHTSELQSLMRNSYAVFCLKK